MDPPPDSSPAWDDKLRLMCSYGGHIIPRPHDKSLFYVGGETRIVVVDRRSSLADLHSRLSHSFLNGRHFTLKYQLPTEDLDSLISIATDYDFDNMIDEYDRTTTAAALKPSSRLRLFLFPSKPETAASMGSLFDDAKSETWFVDALNGAGLLPRGLSESAAIDTLLELNDHPGMVNSDLEAQAQNAALSLGSNEKQQVVGESQQELVVEFGSSSSTPSMANLPPIKVRGGGGEGAYGLDEQFSHVSIHPNYVNATLGGEENIVMMSRVSSNVVGDDERSEKSDHGAVAPTGLRKPPLPLQAVQRKVVDVHNLPPSPDSKHTGSTYNLSSPDSVASDCSMASAGSLSKHTTIYQDAAQFANRDNRVPTPPNALIDQTLSSADNIIHQEPVTTSHQQQMNNIHQQQQQQLVPNTQLYVQQPAMSSPYYPMYIHPQSQQTDPQYATEMYYLPQTHQPYYPSLSTKPEMAGGGGAGPTPMLAVQVPNSHNQFQQQHFINVSQIPTPHHQMQSNNANYGYHDQYPPHQMMMQDQMYYAQHLQPPSGAMPPPSQYQTMTSAGSVMLSQASTQISTDNTNPQQ